MRPTDRLTAENDRLRLRVEALERLAAESRQAEEARRQNEEETRRGAEERRRREIAVLGRVTADVSVTVNLDSVLEQVAEGARELSGGDLVGVALRESDTDAMIFRYWSGVHGVNNATLRVDGGTGLAARVMSLGRAVRTDRYASDPSIGKEYVAAAEHETIASLLAVPIVIGHRVEGIIYVGNQLPRLHRAGRGERAASGRSGQPRHPERAPVSRARPPAGGAGGAVRHRPRLQRSARQ
jgi:transcriptional regulator with GAF, ATPase, and Fis domain